MNVKPSETAALVKGVAEATAAFADKVEVVCCTPAIDVPAAVAAAAPGEKSFQPLMLGGVLPVGVREQETREVKIVRTASTRAVRARTE